MSQACCCRSASPKGAATMPPSKGARAGATLLLVRIWSAVQWALPGLGLALMPKCPACLATYVAVATGLGISLPVASYLRTTLIATCLLSLAYLVFRTLRRRLMRAAG